MKEYTIYSKWLAYELRKQGFRIIRTEVNKNFPQFDTYVFADSEQLQNTITKLTNK